MDFNIQNDSDDLEKKKIHLLALLIIIGVTFLIFVLRLFSLQIIHGEDYKNHSVRISSDVTVLPAQRGEIYDRHANLPLVINTDSFAVELIPGEIPNGYYDTLTLKLAEYLGITKNDIDKKIPKDSRSLYAAIEIKKNVPFSVICDIAENITDLPGVSWKNKPLRNYVETGSVSHVIGYVGDITREELNLMYNSGYTRNSVVGKTGIEKQYDSLLQGKNGREIRTKDVYGRILNAAPIVEPPESGKNLVLTIDSTIQKLVEKALGERVGAAVVLKPSNGEILAMVSYPYFDSNIFSNDDYALQYQKLAEDPNKPLLNRVVNAVYPPASTFKTIMTTAVLNENAFPAEKKIECPGKIVYGNRVFRCHIKEPGHGWLNLKNALAQSCDVYFWVVGRDYLGVDKIADYSKQFGFGQSLEIDFPAQSVGFVPTSLWKERRYHEKWLGGDTMNMSIGQGYTLVTPLHVANMMAMVCNGGVIYKPHLLKEVRDPNNDNEVITEVKPEVLHKSTVAPEVWKQVQEDLRYTITDGTAQMPLKNKVAIAGKTGTAEVSGAKDNHWHSWMAVYAPYDAPPEEQIVVVVLVEAINKWEWWAPYCTNIIVQGIFNDETYEEAVDALGFQRIIFELGRRE